MAITLFLQNFANGKVEMVPFHALTLCLAKYGTIGNGAAGVELTFAPDEIAFVANIFGDEQSGVSCVSLERPIIGNKLRWFAFELMSAFGFSLYDDALDGVYFLHGAIVDFPPSFIDQSETGATKIVAAQQIWPDTLFIPSAPKALPALRYDNANPVGINLFMFDGEGKTEAELLIVANTKDAVWPYFQQFSFYRTLQRLQSALQQNPAYRVICQFPAATLARAENFLTATITTGNIRVRELDACYRSTFLADAQIQQVAQAYAQDLVIRLRNQLGIDLDWTNSSIEVVERVMERTHLAWTSTGGETSFDSEIISFVMMAGSYVAEVHRRQYDGDWGYFPLLGERFPCFRSSAGVKFWPWIQAMNRIADGTEYPNPAYFHSLLAREPQHEDSAATLVRTDSLAPDSEMKSVIEQTRSKFLAMQAMPSEQVFALVRVTNPAWMQQSDPLADIERQQNFLLKNGKIVWAALLQANLQLFAIGHTDCPGLLVYSDDPYFDARPHELKAIARKMFEQKNTTPVDQEARRIANLITDEMDRAMGWQIPDVFTAKAVRSTSFMVFRQHIPNGVLTAEWFPILTHRSTAAVLILPLDFWPVQMMTLWQQRRLAARP